MSPKISIIIPSYNKVKYINLTLKSIFNQNYKNFEVIIQDGGSSDGTLKIIKQYAKKYPRQIKYVSKKDNGQLDAINKGIKKANGDIITFINADDEYVNGAFESVAGHYTDNPNELWFVGKGIVIDEINQEIAQTVTWYKSLLLKFNKYSFLLMTNYMMQPSVFLTSKVVKKYKTFTGNKFAVMEYDMWLNIGRHKMPLIINKVLTKFRLEKDTKTSTNSKKLLIDDQKIVNKYTKNKFILFLHLFHNQFRVIIQKLI